MTGWPSNQPETVAPQESEAEKFARIVDRDNKIKSWLENKKWLESAKETELTSRTVVSALLFPNPSKGTQRFPLDGGYAVKLVQTYNYTLGDKDKIADDGTKVSVAAQVEALQEQIDKLGAEATFIADRLIKWVPELSVTEYEKLGESTTGLKIKELVDAMLTVKPGTPQLTFEVPKGK